MSVARQHFFNLPVDLLSMSETLGWIEEAIRQRSPARQHTVVNAAKIVLAQKEQALRQSILTSDLVNVDGQPVVWAARLLGLKVPEKVSGSDLIMELLQRAQHQKWRLYFLGATQPVLEQMLKRLQKEMPSLVVAGARNGYFAPSQAGDVAQAIRASRPDILFVGMPTPKKENFIRDYKAVMQVPFSMGVGGSFDILAGKTRRAPLWIQKTGLEWLFRLCQEPRRLARRYLKTNTLFIYMLLKEILRRQKG